MNNIKKILFMAMLALPLGTWAAEADSFENLQADTVTALRHYKGGDNWFIGLHGTAIGQLGENIRPRDFFPSFRFGGAISVGKWFSPQVGIRLMGGYNRLAGKADKEVINYAIPAGPGYDGAKMADIGNYSDPRVAARRDELIGKGYYSFSNVYGFVDAMFNLNSIFKPYKESTRFNVNLFFGLGYLHTLGYDEDKIQAWHPVSQGGQMYTGAYFNGEQESRRDFLGVRAGVNLAYALTNALDLTFDAGVMATNDGFNLKRYDDLYDGYIQCNLGLAYHFKDQYGDRRFKYIRASDADILGSYKDRLNQALADLAAAKAAQKDNYQQTRLLDMTVSFFIDRSDITDVQKPNVAAVANYMKSHPEVKVTICGFADVETAYPAYNLRLSERRVNAVYKMLTEEYGVDGSRLTKDFKGDTVQPYKLKNEWNRVVVFYVDPIK